MSNRVVLAPEVSAAEVADTLADWNGGATDLTPALDGEPVSAHWTNGDLEVSYTANPAIGLRVLEGSGVAKVAGHLRLLSGERAVLLAGSSDRGEALLGITALGLLGDMHALPSLQRVVASGDESTRCGRARDSAHRDGRTLHRSGARARTAPHASGS